MAMNTTCEKGLFSGVKVPNCDLTVSYLFYADDALFVAKWTKENIKNLARILRSFHVVSGLKVNFSKSPVFGVGANPLEVSRWAAPLGCKPDELSFTYLGVPVGANMKLLKHWKLVIEKFECKLSLWKTKTLSFGGRLTLLKAMMGNLPTYYFSLFVAPIGITDLLEKNQAEVFIGWKSQ